jgi:hypothetical protein
LKSFIYICSVIPSCLRLFRHKEDLAISLALFNAGSNIAARIAIIAITTRSSINVNLKNLQDLIVVSPFPLLLACLPKDFRFHLANLPLNINFSARIS